MFVARAVLGGDGITAEVLLGSGTRIRTRLEKPSARVYEAIEVIEAEILMRLRKELGLPLEAEKRKPTTTLEHCEKHGVNLREAG